MLTVRAKVQPSPLEGLGLFAVERIPKGTTIWKYDPRFDVSFDPEEVRRMPSEQRALITTYAYLSRDTGKYIYSIDNGRFINHSSKHNNMDVVPFPGEPETRGVANRDIEAGEELLINYRTIDEADRNSSEPYLDR